MRAAIMGVRVRDTTAETRMVRDTVMANSRSNRPTMPPINNTGMKTATKDRLMEMMVKPISLAPLMAASSGRMPRSR